jgi:hypothetical protein
MKTTIKIFRLNCGEDIIAKVEKKDNKYKLIHPIVFMLRNDNKTGNQVVNMSFWLPVSLMDKNEAIIENRDILTVVDPSADFAEYYLGAVESINSSITSFKSEDDDEPLTEENMMSILDSMSVGNNNNLIH